MKIFFAAGPGNLIRAHQNWRRGVGDPSQMSMTFSSELEEFCRAGGFVTYVVASRAPAATIVDDKFTIEHRSKGTGRGLLFHLDEIGYGLGLLVSAVRFGADYAVIQSGTTHYFVLTLFRLFSIKVIPVLHNTLWPAGFRPRSLLRRLIAALDGVFFRWFAAATICVSPECVRQVDQIAWGKHGPILEMRPQFDPNLYPFSPPPDRQYPFRLIFAGRITKDKGAFDLLEIMKEVDRRLPGRVALDICGDGPDLASLRLRCEEMHLGKIVNICGRVEPALLRQQLMQSHAAIVPTRSEFPEGLAMSAIEPVLLGRPVITNPVVPALEVVGDACLAAKADDISSYVDNIITLVQTPELYRQLASACRDLRGMFLDGRSSFGAALRKVMS